MTAITIADIERAAFVAGLTDYVWSPLFNAMVLLPKHVDGTPSHNTIEAAFAPHTNDADAFKLMTMLRIGITPLSCSVDAYMFVSGVSSPAVTVSLPCSDTDRNTMTRYAVVKAASDYHKYVYGPIL